MWHFSMLLNEDTAVAGALSYDVIQAVCSPSDKPYMPLSILALLTVLTYVQRDCEPRHGNPNVLGCGQRVE